MAVYIMAARQKEGRKEGVCVMYCACLMKGCDLDEATQFSTADAHSD